MVRVAGLRGRAEELKIGNKKEVAGAAIEVFLGTRKTQRVALGAGLRGGSREPGQSGRGGEASLIPSSLWVMPRNGKWWEGGGISTFKWQKW